MADIADSDDAGHPATTVVVVTGERYEVDGSPKEVEAAIIAASRGSIMQLAWVSEIGSGRSIGLNPTHIVALEPRASAP